MVCNTPCFGDFFTVCHTPYFLNFTCFARTKSSQIRKKMNQNTITPEVGDELLPTSSSSMQRTISTLEREEENDADGGDSDLEGVEVDAFQQSFLTAKLDRQQNEDGFHVKELEGGDMINFLLSKTDAQNLEGEDDILKKVPKAPDNWVRPAKRTQDEPDFSEVDNPGGWSEFIFRPVYQRVAGSNNKKYLRHELPTGCSPVPINEDGKRMENGWEFFYSGWRSKFMPRRGGTASELFPQERRSSLDYSYLKRLGLTKDCLFLTDSSEPDALFFFQLLLPMCNPKQSGVEDDNRMSYYDDVMRFSNIYRYEKNIGMSYGHKILEASMPEFVHFDGVVVRDGVLGGGDGAIYRCFLKGLFFL